jgi:hypothetical protein
MPVRQVIFADISPAAGIILVLVTVALCGVQWVVLFAVMNALDARKRRKNRDGKPPSKRDGGAD